MKVVSWLIILMFFMVLPAYGGNPAPLFDKPVKVDESGRPLYNSWERYEYERKLRLKRKQQKNKTQTTTSSEVSDPTPSSTIINRPVQSQ